MDQVILDIRKYIAKYQLIRPGDGAVVGLSGGPDSVFLLYALGELKARMHFTLWAVHVHHGIRGAEADRDARFSEKLCQKLAVPFQLVHVEAPAYAAAHGLGLEEAARILRYEALETQRKALAETLRDASVQTGIPSQQGDVESETELKSEEGVRCAAGSPSGGTGEAVIAVAHHLDDQAETVLHHLVRGAGLRGLSGMENRRDHIIRPLLSTKREDILKWLHAHEVDYVLDSTNADAQYTRNRLRTRVLPELKSINPEASAHIARSAALLREADEYFRMLALQYVDRYALPLETSTGSGKRVLQAGTGSEAAAGEETDEVGTFVQTMTASRPAREVTGSPAMALPVTRLKVYPELVRQYVYIEMIRRMGTPLKDWSAVHFRDLDQLIFGPGNAHLDLPYRMSAEYRKRHLTLQKHQEVISVKRRKNHG